MGRLPAMLTITILLSSRPPSPAINSSEYSQSSAPPVGHVKPPEPSPLSVKLARRGRSPAERVGVVPLRSLAMTVKDIVSPPVTVNSEADNTRITGGTAPASSTVITTFSVSDRVASSATNEIANAPTCCEPPAQLKLPVPSPLSTNVAPLGRFSARIDGVVPLGSIAVTVKATSFPATTAKSAMGVISGGTLAAREHE